MRPWGVRSRNPSRRRNGSYTSSIVSTSSAEHRGERLDADRARAELLDDRRQELAIRGVEALVVDLEQAHGFPRRALVHSAVAVDLGVVADALEEPVHDARRSPAPPGDGDGGAGIDLDVEDPGRPLDDLGQLRLLVEVEAVGGPEAVAQRRGDPPGPGRGPDDGERLEGQAQGSGGRPLADHHVEGVVLHRRVEDLFDRVVEAVDLVDEEDVPLVEGGEHGREVPGRSIAGPDV